MPFSLNLLIPGKLGFPAKSSQINNTVYTGKIRFWNKKEKDKGWIFGVFPFLCIFPSAGFQQVAVALGHFALGISAGLQRTSRFPSQLGLSFAEEKVQAVDCTAWAQGAGRVPVKKELVPDLEGKRGLVSFRQEEPEPWKSLAVWRQQSRGTCKDLVGTREPASRRISTSYGDRDDTVIAEISFPLTLELWRRENQGSQFTENKVTQPTHFILLAKRHFFYNNYCVFTVLYKTLSSTDNFKFANLSK